MKLSLLRIYLLLFSLGTFAFSATAQDKSAEAAASSPTAWEAPAQLEAPNLEEITISVRGSQIRVQRAEGQTLTVYNITGIKVASHRIDSEDFSLTLNVERGIYIVKVGKVARRITIA